MDRDSDSAVFVDGLTDELTNTRPDSSRLKDIRLGEKFVFNGKLFKKVSDFGWFVGVMNIENQEGGRSHIHPLTPVSRLN